MKVRHTRRSHDESSLRESPFFVDGRNMVRSYVVNQGEGCRDGVLLKEKERVLLVGVYPK